MYLSLLPRNFPRAVIQRGIHNSSFRYSTSVALYSSGSVSRFYHGLRSISSTVLQTAERTGAKDGRAFSFLVKGATVAGVGLGLSTLNQLPIYCDGKVIIIRMIIELSNNSTESTPNTKGPKQIYPPDRPPPPGSSVSLYELGFGTVSGLCAGVFVKKGAKAVAWFLGGIFVLLQVCFWAAFNLHRVYWPHYLFSNLKYLGSTSVARVDWERAANKFENLFYTKDASGASKPPNVLSLWNWLIDFLTADFQPRASFIAGFALGLRVGWDSAHLHKIVFSRTLHLHWLLVWYILLRLDVMKVPVIPTYVTSVFFFRKSFSVLPYFR